MKRVPLVALTLTILATALQAQTPKVIRLGWVGNKYDKPFTTGVIGYIQENQLWEKEFAKEGIKIEWNFFKGTGPAINEAVANNKLDFASSGDLPSTAGRAGGLPTRVIVGRGAGSGKNYIIVPQSSSVRTPAQLRGKRISFQKGTYYHLMWDRYARDVLKGDGEKDFKVYSLTSGDAEIALASGSVDAILTNSLDIVYKGQGKVVDTITAEKYPKLAGNAGAVYTTQQFADKYPEIVYRWVKVYLKATDDLYKESNRALVNRLGTKTGSSLKSVLANEDKDLRYANYPFFDDLYRQAVESAIDDEVKFRLIRKPFKVSDWWDTRFSERAFKELGLDAKWKDVAARRSQDARRTH